MVEHGLLRLCLRMRLDGGQDRRVPLDSVSVAARYVESGCKEVSNPKSGLSPVRMLIGFVPFTLAFTSADVAVAVGVGLFAGVGESVGVSEGVAVRVGVALGVTTFVAVAVAVLVDVGVLVGVSEGVSVKVGVTVGGSASGKSKMLPAVSISGDVVGSQPNDPSCN